MLSVWWGNTAVINGKGYTGHVIVVIIWFFITQDNNWKDSIEKNWSIAGKKSLRLKRKCWMKGGMVRRTASPLQLLARKGYVWIFLISRIDYSASVIWIFPKYSTCPSGKLRTKITSPIAKSTSPRLSDTTFFAHWCLTFMRILFREWPALPALQQ